ncbi:CGNR zinc finger domain-containing protein [Hamadaea sp. NPDC050747]|uniref:CGNR zinc finger domain-containing protein n=1 Tax=Hamadaea sp. NPDC050747 TaxID=3155789 RepID=UPI0033C4FFF3
METPADLVLLMDFLNTLDQRAFRRRGVDFTGGDDLPTAAALGRWLTEHDLLPASARPSSADLVRAADLRSALRAAVTPDGVPDDALRWTNTVLAAYPLHASVDPGGRMRLESAASGVAGALSRLVAIAVRADADGSWRRLRACAAPECRWVFYDDSRNGAGRWCSMSSCGNRVKTARYRARKAAS